MLFFLCIFKSSSVSTTKQLSGVWEMYVQTGIIKQVTWAFEHKLNTLVWHGGKMSQEQRSKWHRTQAYFYPAIKISWEILQGRLWHRGMFPSEVLALMWTEEQSLMQTLLPVSLWMTAKINNNNLKELCALWSHSLKIQTRSCYYV